MGERDVDPVCANRPIQVGRSIFEVGQERNPVESTPKEGERKKRGRHVSIQGVAPKTKRETREATSTSGAPEGREE